MDKEKWRVVDNYYTNNGGENCTYYEELNIED